MENKTPEGVEQNIKSSVIGANNRTTINQVIVNVNNPFFDSKALSESLAEEIKAKLTDEFVSTDYNILLCYPNKEIDDKPTIVTINKIKDELKGLGAFVYEGGGKGSLPNTDIAYPHIAELEFIKTIRCDTIIIFALDEVTISQLTLISYFKISKEIYSTDMIIISSDELKNSDNFFASGIFQYCDDNNCKLISLTSINETGVKSVIDRIINKKIIQRKAGLLGA
jgi:hypothetical protein